MESAAAYGAVLVPERAIGTDQTKKFVYVVAADSKPQFREVHLGALADGMRVVQGGIKGGEHVVVDGLQRIQPGMTVAPQVLQVDAKGMPIFPPMGGQPGAPALDQKKPATKS
jgi:multidrug efflux system membrane fusion protein